MRRLVLLAAVLASTAPGIAASRSKSEIEWKTHSDASWSGARQSGKPLLIEVWADWCPPCRQMDREVWTDPRIIDLSRKFVCVSIDAGRKLPGAGDPLIFGSHGLYEVKVFPTIVILDPWKEVLLFSPGFIRAGELAAILNEIPDDYNPVRSWRDALESDRSNARALQRVGTLYDRSTAFGIANRYYREALKTPGAREDERLRESLMYGIGVNELRRHDWSAARKALEQFDAAFPDSSHRDEVLCGLILADVRQGKRGRAAARFAELRTRSPNSEFIASAANLLK